MAWHREAVTTGFGASQGLESGPKVGSDIYFQIHDSWYIVDVLTDWTVDISVFDNIT
jgi:hypothetical protein